MSGQPQQVPREQDQLKRRRLLENGGRVVWVLFNTNPVLLMGYIIVSASLGADIPPQNRNDQIFKNYKKKIDAKISRMNLDN